MIPEHYAVIGSPIRHSLSPFIHACFAEQYGWLPDYGRIECAPGQFEQTVCAFMQNGGRGLNVTLPFKHEAFSLATTVQPAARQAGAANVLCLAADTVCCDNTDGAGLVQDLTVNLGIDLKDQRIMLIGAGGAASGIIHPLCKAGVREIVLVNRTLERAEALAQSADHLQAVPIQAASREACDGIINASSAGLQGKPPGLQLPPGLRWGYELAYGRGAQPFMAQLRTAGIRANDGLGMLAEQAALSFNIWHDHYPETATVTARLRARIG